MKEPGRALRRYGPFAVIIVIVAVVALVTVVFGGDDDGDGSGEAEAKSREELVRSGPTTPEKAELLGEEADFGPDCDLETGLVKVPTVYSPPCVEPFTGDNGGATSPGVTADTLKVVHYFGDPALDPQLAAQLRATGAEINLDSARATVQGYFDFYEQHYERYGREVELEFYTGTGPGDDEAAAKADAIAIAEKEPFAVLGAPLGAVRAFSDELAAREVVCLCATAIPEEFVRERAPYLWTVAPSPEETSLLAAEMIGKQAPPGKAEYAGDPELRDRERVYGALHFDTEDGSQEEAFASFERAMADNGIDLAADVRYELDLASIQEDARTLITKLEDADVTTVIFYGDPLMPQALTQEATAQEFFPEWIIGPNVLVDVAVFARGYDQEQWAHAFGISIVGARADDQVQDSYRIYEWQHGEAPPNNTYGVLNPPIGLLFGGIHLAGPELTPESLRDGIFRLPPRGGGPTTPYVSYGDGDIWPYTDLWGVDDATLLWWDPEAEGENEIGVQGNGLYRYANGGKRYQPGEWPSKQEGGLYDVESSVTIFDERPEEDTPPDYPSPAG